MKTAQIDSTRISKRCVAIDLFSSCVRQRNISPSSGRSSRMYDNNYSTMQHYSFQKTATFNLYVIAKSCVLKGLEVNSDDWPMPIRFVILM